MALNIDTFSNLSGGFPFFKAAGHPAVRTSATALLQRLRHAGPIAIYDPLRFAASFAELYPFVDIDLAHVFVQDIEQVGKTVLGSTTQPVTDLGRAEIGALLVVAFDAARLVAQIRHLVPTGATVVTLDEMRIDQSRITTPRKYLDPLNFATNFAFFRDNEDGHTRLVTANYWQVYGASDVRLWLLLLDEGGDVAAEWQEPLPDAPAPVVLDSRDIKARFNLPAFTGQLFVHVVGARGHDVVKYALDTFGEADRVLSCTHDANAWPADFYAGLPAPAPGERVLLWVQNSHPCPIPAGAIGLNLIGHGEVARLDREIPAFGTYPLDVAAMLPHARWPQQIEVRAGRYFVRPRYEVVKGDRRRIAHVNVERTDLEADKRIPELGNLMGAGYILPAPLPSRRRFKTYALPTPMATGQADIPLALVVRDTAGRQVARHVIGRSPRSACPVLDLDEILEDETPNEGHLELVYDFEDGGDADGWLHALFRYEDRDTGHIAETSFGAHMFNTVLVYRNEPQSYGGPAPGLSTRLFLRVGPVGEVDTFCHLIYPASTPWHTTSDTRLTLIDAAGHEVATRRLEIPCGGSHHWRLMDMFAPAEYAQVERAGYVLVRDTTCRLFGYHGLVRRNGAAFSLDHMFGF